MTLMGMKKHVGILEQRYHKVWDSRFEALDHVAEELKLRCVLRTAKSRLERRHEQRECGDADERSPDDVGSRKSAGLRVALIGADTDALRWLVRTRPDASFVQNIPPMGVASNSAAQDVIVDFVETADADVVLFALGAPHSELLCQRIAEIGAVHGVGLCIGASIEFLSGAKRRAPLWIRRLRLEWAFRLASEPRRLWRRYLIEGPRIFAIWRDWKRLRRA